MSIRTTMVAGRRWEWIRTNAAWVVHLPQGGEVTSALQMFGSVTFWVFWENGFHALRSLDDNGDGEIAGEELRGMRVPVRLSRNHRHRPVSTTTPTTISVTR